jgi:hypothetical protein
MTPWFVVCGTTGLCKALLLFIDSIDFILLYPYPFLILCPPQAATLVCLVDLFFGTGI